MGLRNMWLGLPRDIGGPDVARPGPPGGGTPGLKGGIADRWGI